MRPLLRWHPGGTIALRAHHLNCGVDDRAVEGGPQGGAVATALRIAASIVVGGGRVTAAAKSDGLCVDAWRLGLVVGNAQSVMREGNRKATHIAKGENAKLWHSINAMNERGKEK